ncbi:MAG: NAD-dependent epimerase/dehydratase family protein [Chloroflexi bacterium]|nr:NAD-dependent epimerase/dehydratase family protein [Chloroflexota bacterium]
MKYLITGGAGFIGSHIARALLELGSDVRVLDNFSSGKRENLQGLEVDLIEGDLRDAARVAESVRGINVIFHEAAFVSVPESMEKPQECFDESGCAACCDCLQRGGVW